MIMELFVEVDGVKTHFPMYDGETMEDVDKRIDDYRIRRRKRTFISKRLDEIECKDEFYRDCALMWDEYFEKSYQVLLDNPNITLEEFLKQTGIDKL